MKAALESLFNDSQRLRTFDKGVPNLHLTEFGYFNRPLNQKVSDASYHSEERRASWYELALDKARRHGARMFLIYETVEVWPTNAANVKAPENFPAFDVGLIHPDTGEVRGTRPYGKGDRLRRAYCRIHAWARTHGYRHQLGWIAGLDRC